jgi:hypothetical protein
MGVPSTNLSEQPLPVEPVYFASTLTFVSGRPSADTVNVYVPAVPPKPQLPEHASVPFTSVALVPGTLLITPLAGTAWPATLKLLSVNCIIGVPVCLFFTEVITTAGLPATTIAAHVND